jgi:hypothetical protein
VSAPPKLYKYEPWSLQALENLKRQVIHFGSPLGFNDPYDCALRPGIRRLSDAEVDSIRELYIQEKRVPEATREEFRNTDRNILREIFTRASTAGFQEATSHFLNTRGVACFSERNDDLLMWSHYGGRYKGFCLEFATFAAPFEKVRQVRYSKVLPEIDVATVLTQSVPDSLLDDLFCTKSDSWAYEREWRSIHGKAGTQFCYEAEALTGIYFGPDIDPQCLEIACLILRGQNKHTKLWKGQRSASEFRVDFSEFEYMSYLEAKANAKL